MIDRFIAQKDQHPAPNQNNSLRTYRENKKRRRIWPFTLLPCCSSIGLCIIASVIVLSLIPVYLGNKNLVLNNNKQVSNGFIIAYVTNFTNITTFTIANRTTLATNFMKELNIKGIIISKATFIDSSSSVIGARKRRAANERSQSILNTEGVAIFVIEFYYIYPSTCRLIACHKKYDAEIRYKIEILHQRIILLTTFTNGQTLFITLDFYTFDPILIPARTNNETTTDTTFIETNTSTTYTGLTIRTSTAEALTGIPTTHKTTSYTKKQDKTSQIEGKTRTTTIRTTSATNTTPKQSQITTTTKTTPTSITTPIQTTNTNTTARKTTTTSEHALTPITCEPSTNTTKPEPPTTLRITKTPTPTTTPQAPTATTSTGSPTTSTTSRTSTTSKKTPTNTTTGTTTTTSGKTITTSETTTSTTATTTSTTATTTSTTATTTTTTTATTTTTTERTTTTTETTTTTTETTTTTTSETTTTTTATTTTTTETTTTTTATTTCTTQTTTTTTATTTTTTETTTTTTQTTTTTTATTTSTTQTTTTTTATTTTTTETTTTTTETTTTTTTTETTTTTTTTETTTTTTTTETTTTTTLPLPTCDTCVVNNFGAYVNGASCDTFCSRAAAYAAARAATVLFHNVTRGSGGSPLNNFGFGFFYVPADGYSYPFAYLGNFSSLDGFFLNRYTYRDYTFNVYATSVTYTGSCARISANTNCGSDGIFIFPCDGGVGNCCCGITRP